MSGMGKSRRGSSGVGGGKGICYQWAEKKASVSKETVAVSATKPKIVEVCRGKEVSEAKVTMVPFFDNRADIVI